MGQFIYPNQTSGCQYVQIQTFDANGVPQIQFAPIFTQIPGYMMPNGNIPPTNCSEATYSTANQGLQMNMAPMGDYENNSILVPDKPKQRWKREDDKKLFAFLRKY